jgi:oligopeptide transport system substrate-binding protein
VAYETGQVALVTDVPAMVREALLEARREGRRGDVLHGHDFATYFYRFNCRRPPLDDRRVRQALVRAIDRQAVIARAARGGQAPARVLVPPGLPGYRSPPCMGEGAAEARRLLAAAGYGPAGRRLPELAILVNKGAGHVPVAEVLQHQWRQRLDLVTRIEQVEFKVLLDRVRDGQFQIARAGWFGDYLDPNTFLDMFVTDGGNNRTGWSSAAYDGLIAAAAAEPDPAARTAVLARAEAVLLEDVPIMPIYFYSTMMLARPGLEGIEPNLLNRIDFGALRWGAGGPAPRAAPRTMP